jgi:hypothetical protein
MYKTNLCFDTNWSYLSQRLLSEQYNIMRAAASLQHFKFYEPTFVVPENSSELHARVVPKHTR